MMRERDREKDILTREIERETEIKKYSKRNRERERHPKKRL